MEAVTLSFNEDCSLLYVSSQTLSVYHTFETPRSRKFEFFYRIARPSSLGPDAFASSFAAHLSSNIIYLVSSRARNNLLIHDALHGEDVTITSISQTDHVLALSPASNVLAVLTKSMLYLYHLAPTGDHFYSVPNRDTFPVDALTLEELRKERGETADLYAFLSCRMRGETYTAAFPGDQPGFVRLLRLSSGSVIDANSHVSPYEIVHFHASTTPVSFLHVSHSGEYLLTVDRSGLKIKLWHVNSLFGMAKRNEKIGVESASAVFAISSILTKAISQVSGTAAWQVTDVAFMRPPMGFLALVGRDPIVRIFSMKDGLQNYKEKRASFLNRLIGDTPPILTFELEKESGGSARTKRAMFDDYNQLHIATSNGYYCVYTLIVKDSVASAEQVHNAQFHDTPRK